MRTPPSHSSMSPSMSSIGWEQQGWELLGGAAELVTRSISGTKASHYANKGKACCIAMSHACRRLLPLGNLIPSTSRQWDDAALVQSCSMPLCAAITNFACILATPRPLFGSWLPACVSGVPSGATTVTTSTLCRSAPFPDGASVASGVPGPPKKKRMSPSSATASLPCRH